MSTRGPSVAGKFYPSTDHEIKQQIADIQHLESKKINLKLAQRELIGGVSPHAGYVYSGYEALHLFRILSQSEHKFDTFFILHPNHTGYGSAISMDVHSHWETPMGKVPIDEEFKSLLPFDTSEMAHRYEHSGEVIVPFLQYYLEYEFSILPICILSQTYENASFIARELHRVNQELGKKIFLIASSDFSHFVSPEYGYAQDEMALKEILKFRSREFYEVVKKKDISMCGYGPIMSLLEYAKLITNDPKIEILARGNSGKTYPSSEVVDYVSMLVYQ